MTPTTECRLASSASSTIASATATRRMSSLEKTLLAILALPFIIYGSTKAPQSTVDFLRTDADMQYFYDRGSYVTNDYVYVDFTTQVVPASANFYGEYRELALSNDTDWVEFVNTTIEDFAPPQPIAFDNATNYCFRFYTDWTPGPAVVTNGVLKINWGVPVTPPEPFTINAVPVQTEIELLEE